MISYSFISHSVIFFTQRDGSHEIISIHHDMFRPAIAAIIYENAINYGVVMIR